MAPRKAPKKYGCRAHSKLATTVVCCEGAISPNLFFLCMTTPGQTGHMLYRSFLKVKISVEKTGSVSSPDLNLIEHVGLFKAGLANTNDLAGLFRKTL
ncbi:hypothetical protein TNCV_5105141 [Trichonephila clavipes]|nr:hypothetical protein TNCV_5105141 [Trichonephila clavipes]